MSRIRPLLVLCALAALGACGGGGGGGNPPASVPPAPTVPSGPNVQAIHVDGGPNGNVPDLAYTQVTVCQAGSSNCVTIDHVLIDTGSNGLRVLSSVLAPLAPALQPQLNASNDPLYECVQFVDNSHVWGPVKIADVKIAGEVASSVRIQQIGDSAATEPAGCSGGDPASNLDTMAELGANAVLGINNVVQDCGPVCAGAPSADPNWPYYACSGTVCAPSSAALVNQVENPVAKFATDNNGTLIQLPAVAAAGSARVDGWLIFGIGTQSNNGLGGATVFTLNNDGYITSTYLGHTYSQSFVDSGSNGLFFPNVNTPPIPLCQTSTDFYCPNPPLTNLSATISGKNSATTSIGFGVANTEALNGSFFAFNNLAGPYADGFDWGLPFFFGRTVYTAIAGQPGVAEPYIAF